MTFADSLRPRSGLSKIFFHAIVCLVVSEYNLRVFYVLKSLQGALINTVGIIPKTCIFVFFFTADLT